MPWLLAARPKTLFASISPVLLATYAAFYDGYWYPLTALLVLLTGVFIQVFTNYVNDYYDFLKGADEQERIGPQRMVASGRIKPASMKKGILIVGFICLLLGGWIVYLTDYYILLIGIFSLIFAYLYTAGPYPLAYHGLGEVFAFYFFWACCCDRYLLYTKHF